MTDLVLFPLRDPPAGSRDIVISPRPHAVLASRFPCAYDGTSLASSGPATNYFIIRDCFYKIFTMPDEPGNPVTTRVAALGHSLASIRARAEEAVFRLVLICTLLGYRMVRPDEDGRMVYRAVPVRAGGVSSPCIRGILPAGTGTPGRVPAALLHS